MCDKDLWELGLELQRGPDRKGLGEVCLGFIKLKVKSRGFVAREQCVQFKAVAVLQKTDKMKEQQLGQRERWI